MRPINLKIKGLNSFIEEQHIDFEKLTERGLFGIFGPTGSGKSTILDGITLALYGEVSRKSTNFINTNCDNLSISFEFQISGAEVKRYRIDREFKRDKKSGNPMSGKCKIIDITGEEPLILGDKVREVTDKCKSIIGLSLEDFTRTVVLPQGQFSEFLKLEGKSRREMLERLFNLQQYGDDLTYKLSREIGKNRVENNQLIGQMKGYEDITSDRLEILEGELKAISSGYKDTIKEHEKMKKDFQEKNELWNLQKELVEYNNKEEILKKQAEDIKEKKETLILGESALKVSPFIIGYESTTREIDSSQIEEKNLKISLDNFKKEKQKAEESFNIICKKKDTELPELKIKEDRARDALKEKQLLDSLDSEIKRIKDLSTSLQVTKNNDEDLLKETSTKIETTNLSIKNSEEKLNVLKIDSKLKEQVQQGIILSGKNEDLKSRLENNKNKAILIEDNLKEDSIKNKDLEEKQKKNLSLFNSKNKELEELRQGTPGGQNDLLDLQKTLGIIKDKWAKFNKASSEIQKFETQILNIKSSLEKLINEKEEVSKNLTTLKELKRNEEILSLSNTLRRELKEGETCPVCGSREHFLDEINTKETENIQEIEGELNSQEELLRSIQSKITICETKLQVATEGINNFTLEIKNLGEDYKEKTVEALETEFNNFIKLLEEYDKKKKLLEEEVGKLKDENYNFEGQITKIITVIAQNQKQLEGLQEETKKLNDEYVENNKALEELISDCGIKDFNNKNEEIKRVEKELDTLSENLKKLRSEIEILNKKKDEVQLNINTISARLIKGEALLAEKENIREEKVALIKSKVENEEDIESLLKLLEKQMYEIEESYKLEQLNKEKVDKNYQDCNENLISIVGKINQLINREKTEKERLDQALKEESFNNIDEVKKNIITKETITELKVAIDEYNNLLSMVNGALESLNKKINNREISEEAFNKLQKDKEDKEKYIEELKEELIKKEEEVNLLQKKLIEFDALIKVKEKLEHKLALLGDLEKLFKGKKFVEFVAITRLKYISKEASKRLEDISSGTYGIEVDENGRFIIRDNKNGGIARDTSTLSGGETFLASLALALALSAEIQLKGTAPLELFFLDEGFGTLDDNLLEIVMSSLERIHNDKLKVGIISHVESIKNRVPVKLMITPAESGMGGSKVKIERS